jgi:hypothetical protein
MIRILIATLLAVVLQFSVSAQGQRSETIQKLYEFTQDVSSDKLSPVRGGTKAKGLGCYLREHKKVWGLGRGLGFSPL